MYKLDLIFGILAVAFGMLIAMVVPHNIEIETLIICWMFSVTLTILGILLISTFTIELLFNDLYQKIGEYEARIRHTPPEDVNKYITDMYNRCMSEGCKGPKVKN